MAITVTASEASAAAWYLRVLVLTGATAAGGKNGTVRSATPQVSITPNASNSLIVWAVENFSSNVVPTVASNNTALDGAAGTQGDAYSHGYYSGTVTSGSAVTVGCSSAGTSQMAAYEVLASGGSTPVQDASAPPLKTAGIAASVTTASFSPPVGSVLVALIATYDNSGSPSLSVSDSSSLTWTQRAFSNQFNETIAAVYTATVPAASGTPASILAARPPAALVRASVY